jgi:hypothetical protein
MGDEAGDNLLGLGARDEHVGANMEAAGAEVGVAYDVLDGAETLQVLYGPVEPEQVGLVDGVVAVQQKVGLVPSEKGIEEHIDKHAQFPFGVEAAEFVEVVTLNIAHAVGRDVHVGGVHGSMS